MGSPTFTIVTLVCTFSIGLLGSSSQAQLLGEGKVEAEQHTPIILRCRVPSTTKQVIWERESVTIGEDPTRKITIAFSNVQPNSSTHDSVLTIAEAEQADSGSYRCSGEGVQSDKTVDVTVIESQISVSAIHMRVNLVQGSPLTLTCQADIHTHVEWRKESIVLSDGGEFKITEDITNPDEHVKMSTLTIDPAAASHAGTYVCQNKHHNDDKDEIIVSLKSETSGKSSTSEVSALLFGSVVVLALLR